MAKSVHEGRSLRRIQRDDRVEVIRGRSKGKIGTVIEHSEGWSSVMRPTCFFVEFDGHVDEFNFDNVSEADLRRI
jgi:hypothetical protein